MPEFYNPERETLKHGADPSPRSELGWGRSGRKTTGIL